MPVYIVAKSVMNGLINVIQMNAMLLALTYMILVASISSGASVKKID